MTNTSINLNSASYRLDVNRPKLDEAEVALYNWHFLFETGRWTAAREWWQRYVALAFGGAGREVA